jgi:hypothetical protein
MKSKSKNVLKSAKTIRNILLVETAIEVSSCNDTETNLDVLSRQGSKIQVIDRFIEIMQDYCDN